MSEQSITMTPTGVLGSHLYRLSASRDSKNRGGSQRKQNFVKIPLKEFLAPTRKPNFPKLENWQTKTATPSTSNAPRDALARTLLT